MYDICGEAYRRTHTRRSNFLLNFIAQVESNVRMFVTFRSDLWLQFYMIAVQCEWLQHYNINGINGINEYTLVKSVIQLFVLYFSQQSFRWIKLFTHNPNSEISKKFMISSSVWMNFCYFIFFIFQITNYARNYIHLLCFLFRIFILFHGFITIFL